MTTDTKWAWMILMRNGESFHITGSYTLERALRFFYDAGHQETEIEAIIRH